MAPDRFQRIAKLREASGSSGGSATNGGSDHSDRGRAYATRSASVHQSFPGCPDHTYRRTALVASGRGPGACHCPLGQPRARPCICEPVRLRRRRVSAESLQQRNGAENLLQREEDRGNSSNHIHQIQKRSTNTNITNCPSIRPFRTFRIFLIMRRPRPRAGRPQKAAALAVVRSGGDGRHGEANGGIAAAKHVRTACKGHAGQSTRCSCWRDGGLERRAGRHGRVSQSHPRHPRQLTHGHPLLSLA